MDVFQRIKILRKTTKKGQKEVAAELGLGVRQYINLETGVSDPKLSQLIGIAKALGVQPWQLFAEPGELLEASGDEVSLLRAWHQADDRTRQAVAILLRLEKPQTEDVSEPPKEEVSAPTSPPPAPAHTLRSGQVIDIDEYRARLSEDAQGDLTDEEVAEIAQFEESCVHRGVRFHEFSLDEIFTSSANRVRELIDMGRQVDLC